MLFKNKNGVKQTRRILNNARPPFAGVHFYVKIGIYYIKNGKEQSICPKN